MIHGRHVMDVVIAIHEFPGAPEPFQAMVRVSYDDGTSTSATTAYARRRCDVLVSALSIVEESEQEHNALHRCISRITKPTEGN